MGVKLFRALASPFELPRARNTPEDVSVLSSFQFNPNFTDSPEFGVAVSTAETGVVESLLIGHQFLQGVNSLMASNASLSHSRTKLLPLSDETKIIFKNQHNRNKATELFCKLQDNVQHSCINCSLANRQ